MKFIVAIAITMLSFSAAHAANDQGIQLEPYAGYYRGALKSDALTGGDIESYVVGAKLGYMTDIGFGYGIDYSQGTGDVDYDGGTSDDWNTKQIGAFLNYNITEDIGLWATYMPEFEVESTDTREQIDGDGYSVGISLKLLTYFRIQAEYRIRNLKEQSGVSLTGDNSTETTFVSASFPVNFPYRFGN